MVWLRWEFWRRKAHQFLPLHQHTVNPTRLSGKHTKAAFACSQSIPSTMGSLLKRKKTWNVQCWVELDIAVLDFFPQGRSCRAGRGGRRAAATSLSPTQLLPHGWPGWGIPGTSRICTALCWHFGFVQFGLKLRSGPQWMIIVPSFLCIPSSSKRNCLPCSSWCACLLSWNTPGAGSSVP